MSKYVVVGTQPVGGVEPGGTVDLDLDDECIAALVAAKAIGPVKAVEKAVGVAKADEKAVEKPGD